MTDIVERLEDWPHGHSTMIVSEAIDEIKRLRRQVQQQPWQNLDSILNAMEAADCCHDDYVHAPQDVVANALRDWLRSASERAKDTP